MTMKTQPVKFVRHSSVLTQKNVYLYIHPPVHSLMLQWASAALKVAQTERGALWENSQNLQISPWGPATCSASRIQERQNIMLSINRHLKEENASGNGTPTFINSCLIGLSKLLPKVHSMSGINNMALMLSMTLEPKSIPFWSLIKLM